MKYILLILTLYFQTLNIFSQNTKEHKYELDSNNIKIFLTVDTLPAPGISEIEFFKLLNSDLKWPDVDADCWFDKVYYELIITDNGTILSTNLRIGDIHCNDNNRITKMQEKLKLNLDEIVLKLPIWKPAVVNGENVTAKWIIPIHVHLN